ncbi:carotenoid biosynthesis protein [Mycobacterium sp. MYCO198283]|uniref:carotenoid biosynthesis protein n=1 Tax=Mycobacterium sp. MYCO198283 TaxID=2883505 RepID=UPI001E3C375F|nr:carotenoid biosynthesis protein [Mycobacterium sp. MYCO198283]MCG5433311.1 carotenoid biosynthesis protein [Mycobacterium sp. MYCO198283]
MALAVREVAVRTVRPVWLLVAAAIGVQIAYPLMPDGLRSEVTVASVVVFFVAALADVTRLHGRIGALTVIAVAGGGGLLAEAVGVATGWPFGAYSYTGTLGPELVGVPIVVPMAWAMMAWPALVVARTLAVRTPAVVAVGAAALTAWDVFLDPQMVDAGHWRWFDPQPALPLVPGIPLTNFAGWLLVSALVIALLHRTLPDTGRPSAPAAALYLWVYFSSALGHLAFFGLPGSAVVGGVLMGAVAVPFAVTLWRRRKPQP